LVSLKSWVAHLLKKKAGPGLGGSGTGPDAAGVGVRGSDSVEIVKVAGGGPLRLRPRDRFSRHRKG
jgi:hypothetical protein